MTPARMLLPDLGDDVVRRRGRQKTPTREPVILRLDRAVTAALRRSGPGWQSRAAALLKGVVLGAATEPMALHEAQAPAPAAPGHRADDGESAAFLKKSSKNFPSLTESQDRTSCESAAPRR